MKCRETIIEKIDSIERELIQLSNKIHEKPELAFEEFSAVENITAVLERHGFTIEKGIGGLETAFRGEYHGKNKEPTVAFLAEYDALPEIGHGCGHNLIATMAVGALLA